MLEWKDPSPHRAGKHVSFRTGNSQAEFADMRVYKLATVATPTISVGNSSSMIRFKSQGDQAAARIFSLALNKDGGWSALKEEPIKIE